MVVIFGFVASLQPVTEEAQKSGAKLAKVSMNDSVQRYRQVWLMQGEPSYIDMDGHRLSMTHAGLVSPFNQQGILDCGYWLAVHYPQRNIMTSELSDIEGKIYGNVALCHYVYQNGQHIVVRMTVDQTTIDVKFPAE